MIISDKQELRRCVKQIVRRANVCEADLAFDIAQGELGVEAMLDVWTRPAASPGEALRRACAEQTPFSQDAIAMFAALDAMDLPTHDLDRAQVQQREYERPAYLRELLDTLRAKCVLVRVPLDRAADAQFDDDRLEPLFCVDGALITPGRYGVDYAAAARRIVEAAGLCGARNVRLDRFDEQAFRYLMMPLCEDQGYALHVHLTSREELNIFTALMDAFDGVRALVSAEAELETQLIQTAAIRPRMLVRLSDPSHIGTALAKLGTRFVPYAACAAQPELMLGRWIAAKEQIWQALAEAYLPLARAGYELQSAAIERDVRRLMSENLLVLCRGENA